MGFSFVPFRVYRRWRPNRRSVTRPTLLSTPKCFETCGWGQPRDVTRSFTGRSPCASTPSSCRRFGSATALKASRVVGASGISGLIFLYGNMSTLEAAKVFHRLQKSASAGNEEHIDQSYHSDIIVIASKGALAMNDRELKLVSGWAALVGILLGLALIVLLATVMII